MKVVRVQVKTTTLWNESTNNSIAGLEKGYDFIVIVIVDRKEIVEVAAGSGETDDLKPEYDYIPHFYIMTKKEAMTEKGSSKQLGVSRKVNKESVIKESLRPYLNAWKKITHATHVS
ncbi:hypothetical protein LJR289_001887 [Pseudoduganella sp. LjRoot289]|uniref:hypothetical protein n=1 Tax=Pseudoduganella sp. LjRoot289 TaxID=3342314 RepID=UPI003ECF9782